MGLGFCRFCGAAGDYCSRMMRMAVSTSSSRSAAMPLINELWAPGRGAEGHGGVLGVALGHFVDEDHDFAGVAWRLRGQGDGGEVYEGGSFNWPREKTPNSDG